MSALAGLKMPRSYSVWALAVIVAVVTLLAYQQYRWIDKVAEVEEKTSREKLETSLKGFADDFDAEITRAHLVFVGLEGPTRNDVLQKARERLLIFRRLSNYPALIGSIDAENGFPAPHTIEPGPPPTLIIPTPLLRAVKHGIRMPFFGASTSVVADVGEGSQVGGQAEIRMGFGVPLQIQVILDEKYIHDALLPELLKRHLGANAEQHYDVFIRSVKDNGSILHWGAGNKSPWESSMRVFAIRPDCLLGQGDQPYLTKDSPTTISTGVFTGPRTISSRMVPDLPSLLRRPASCNAVSNARAGLWLVSIRARPSLREAIDSARRQNLAVSLGVVLVLGMAILALFISGHRARELAARHAQFAASVSHELRTPLSVISSASANLADGVIDAPDQVRQYGKMIRSHSEQLTGMIENALWFAQKNAGTNLETEKIAVEELISTAAATCSRVLQQSSVTLERDLEPGLPYIRGNRILLLHALQNLITNAASHGSSGGWVRVRAGRKEGKVVFTVEDRGQGISPEEVKRVFEPFYRGRAAKQTPQGGLGLGLTLVRKIVEAHGETIELRSRHTVGTTVSFTVPICASDEVEPRSLSSQLAHG
jgi:signal transduction histidine kinase